MPGINSLWMDSETVKVLRREAGAAGALIFRELRGSDYLLTTTKKF